MRRFSTVPVCLTLSLMLVLSGITWARAHGAAPAVGTVVICGAEGVVTLSVDADGRPVEATHPCPDCVIAVAGLVTAQGVTAVHPTRPARGRVRRGANLRRAQRLRRRHGARAPPAQPV